MLPPLQPTLGAYVNLLFRRFDDQSSVCESSESNVALYKATPSLSSSLSVSGQIEYGPPHGGDSDEGNDIGPPISCSVGDLGDGLPALNPILEPFFILHPAFAAFTLKHYSDFTDKPPGPRFKSSLNDAAFSSGPYCIDEVELCVAVDKKWVTMHKFSVNDLASLGRKLRSTTRYFCLR